MRKILQKGKTKHLPEDGRKKGNLIESIIVCGITDMDVANIEDTLSVEVDINDQGVSLWKIHYDILCLIRDYLRENNESIAEQLEEAYSYFEEQ